MQVKIATLNMCLGLKTDPASLTEDIVYSVKTLTQNHVYTMNCDILHDT